MESEKSHVTLLIEVSSYKLDKNIITNDLSKERPPWILSAYGPGREAPLQLFGGQPREQSFEEIRVRHYELTAQGNQQQAIGEYQTLVNNAEQQCRTALNDVDGAIKYILNGENEHPNRNDICKAKGALPTQPHLQAASQQPTSAFGLPSNPAPTFGQPSAPSTFGKPAFDQSSAPGSTFGQPSFGQPSVFGKPSSLGQPSAGFSQPSSTFGKPSFPAPTFGQPSAPGIFGQPRNASPFGVPASTTGTMQTDQPRNTFGQPSTPPQQNPFGQPSTSTQPNPFGQPSAPSQSSPFTKVSPFSQPPTSNTTTAPTQPTAAPANPFGQPSAPQTANPFAKPPTTAPTPFGQPSKTRIYYANRPVPSFGFDMQAFKASLPSTSTSTSTSTHPTNNPITAPAPTTASQAPANVQKDAQNKLRTWNNKPVTYIDEEPCFKSPEGYWTKIWFPDGPPVFKKSEELPEEVYDEGIKENYRYLKEHGTFLGGSIPELPPRREWVGWNF